jgi:hypothetical protein
MRGLLTIAIPKLKRRLAIPETQAIVRLSISTDPATLSIDESIRKGADRSRANQCVSSSNAFKRDCALLDITFPIELALRGFAAKRRSKALRDTMTVRVRMHHLIFARGDVHI